MWEYLRDEFRDKVDEMINDAFYEHQVALHIDTGDLPPLLSYHIDEALDNLCEQIDKGMMWQAAQEEV